MSSGRILVVDRDDSIRDFMTMVLTDEGYEVRTVADDTEGLATIQAFYPDLLILDMPRLDDSSPRVVSSYRQRLRSTCAMMVLSTSPGISIETAQALGVEVCISKPFDVVDLLDCVERNLPLN